MYEGRYTIHDQASTRPKRITSFQTAKNILPCCVESSTTCETDRQTTGSDLTSAIAFRSTTIKEMVDFLSECTSHLADWRARTSLRTTKVARSQSLRRACTGTLVKNLVRRRTSSADKYCTVASISLSCVSMCPPQHTIATNHLYCCTRKQPGT